MFELQRKSASDRGQRQRPGVGKSSVGNRITHQGRRTVDRNEVPDLQVTRALEVLRASVVTVSEMGATGRCQAKE